MASPAVAADPEEALASGTVSLDLPFVVEKCLQGKVKTHMWYSQNSNFLSLLGSRTTSGSFLLLLTLSVRRRWERRRRGRRSGAAAARRRRGSCWRGAQDHQRGGFGAEAAFPSDIGKCRSERRGRQTRNTARGDFTFKIIGNKIPRLPSINAVSYIIIRATYIE